MLKHLVPPMCCTTRKTTRSIDLIHTFTFKLGKHMLKSKMNVVTKTQFACKI